MDDFNTIRLKKKTLDKFKNYSKKISPSYSETLDFMMAFFQDNNLTPYDTLRMNNTALMNLFNKRLDAIVSIFRNVEETQLKPTKKMLEALFEEMDTIQTPTEETYEFGEPKLITENEELTYYRNAYYKQQMELNELKHNMKDAFDKFKRVKNTFGSDNFVLKVSEPELKALKNSIA